MGFEDVSHNSDRRLRAWAAECALAHARERGGDMNDVVSNAAKLERFVKDGTERKEDNDGVSDS
jgi:hypothetical protein